mgnify:CR=1 FL=1
MSETDPDDIARDVRLAANTWNAAVDSIAALVDRHYQAGEVKYCFWVVVKAEVDADFVDGETTGRAALLAVVRF